MAGFKPKSTGGGAGGGDREYEPRNLPTPREGSRKARVSLIIDLGTQNREDFEDEVTKEKKPQKPCQQVVVFADLVADVVDYGGKIGKQQYRMLLNKSFQGVVQGINFTTTPPKDAKGNLIQGKPWGLHPANLLTKLAKATGNEEIIAEDRKNPKSLDISLLLDAPFMCQVEVKKTPALDKATGVQKKDKDGKDIVYTNVNFKGAAPVPTVEDDATGEEKPIPVAELTQPARCITFDSATEDDIQFIRPSIIKIIKQANDYAGSAMQTAIEAYEASQGTAGDGDEGDEQEEAPKTDTKPKAAAPKKEPAKPKAKPASAPVDPEEEDVPF